MKEVIGENFHKFTTPGSMGFVTDTRYIRCYWPKLDNPVALFEKGSSGIEVQGPPTPRNVVFPEGTVALNILADDAEIIVKDGTRINSAKWRETGIPTKLDCYYTTAIETKEFESLISAAKTVELEPGIFREVEYSKPGTEMKDVEVFTGLTEKQARDLAAEKASR